MNCFPARRLLKGISVFLGVLVLGLFAAVLLLALARNDRQGNEIAVAAGPVFLLPALYVLKMINDSFSVLEIDEKGVRVRKWIGGADLDWSRIGLLRYWEQVQIVHGAQSLEYFAELSSPEGKRLLRLKSSYERAAFQCLIQSARERKVRIDS